MIKQSRLLVVDPNKAILASMTKRFHEFGFSVQAVESGEKAIESASQRRPDLVVVDIGLSGMNSFELLGRLRAMPDISDVPVLLVGTSKEIESSVFASEPGKYRVDSIDFPSLPRKIRELLATYKRRRTIEELLVKDSMSIITEGVQELTAIEQQSLRRAEADLEYVELGVEDPTLRGKTEYLNLLESSFTTAQVSKLLRVNESRVRQRLTSQPPSLYGIKRGTEWLIPLFQFEGKKLIPNLERAIAKLDANLNPVSVWRWFTSPDADLVAEESPEGGFSPRDWLLRGLPVEAVEELAENLHLS